MSEEIAVMSRREAGIRLASDMLAEAIKVARYGDVPRVPKTLCWGREATFRFFEGATFAADAEAVRLRAEKSIFAETLRVERDPCPKCGVRRDAGCKHRKAA